MDIRENIFKGCMVLLDQKNIHPLQEFKYAGASVGVGLLQTAITGLGYFLKKIRMQQLLIYHPTLSVYTNVEAGMRIL